ncbi:uncharacterized protein CC84DRAFT_586910 [Paraphaeosphaeria sporulosa]|uniref:Uncharacterized protein n=1 Tax=Paraphaeosphaeria sporulosa TaxID=1460663 RepID=A0A177CPP4_9PLEO|nr:uncharacterized protein CC84DRAFT_586910 [Paraphaeosphaeria sporulosa]OAG08759.1 hypothetical protein CC84DRAFT_586910 [Paraphaeosphaeria sporulosa]
MCYYRLYIFLGCGHTTFSARPVRPCAAARSKRIAASQHQHTDTAQGVPPNAPPQAYQPTSPIAATHATGITTFHTLHPSTPHPHADSANIPQDPVTSRLPDTPTRSEECADVLTHPFQTLNIHTSCALCLRQRAALLQQLEEETATSAVRFEDWRWKVKYLSPTPEEARYAAEWKNVGSVMGSWVKDWKVKGDEILGVLRETVGEGEERRRDSVGSGLGLGLGIKGVLGTGRKKAREV